MTSDSNLFSDLPTQVSMGSKRACVRREIAMRERNYPRWVKSGTMTQAIADREIRVMRAVLETLEGLTDDR